MYKQELETVFAGHDASFSYASGCRTVTLYAGATEPPLPELKAHVLKQGETLTITAVEDSTVSVLRLKL